MRKAIGCAMLVFPFMAMFLLALLDIGLFQSVLVFATSFAIVASIAVGIDLILEDKGAE
jgi:hypothetical protein